VKHDVASEKISTVMLLVKKIVGGIILERACTQYFYFTVIGASEIQHWNHTELLLAHIDNFPQSIEPLR
jgi:hypothetical protein